MRTDRRPGRRPRGDAQFRPYRWSFTGMVGLAMVLFLDLATAGTAPWWVTALFLLLWVLCFGLACLWFVRRPHLVPLLPLVAFAVWAPVIAVGTRQLGWGS